MKLLRLLFLVILVNVFGCATPEIYVSSLSDKNYRLDKNIRLTFFDTEEKGIELKNFCLNLRKEMERLGFNFVPIEKSDYLLIVDIDEKASTVSGILPMPTTSHTSGMVGDTYYSGTTSSTNYIPYTRSYIIKKIYLTLGDFKKYVNEGKTISVWEGYIGADKEDYEENVNDCLYTLLQYFGTDFEGHIHIQKDKTRMAQ